MGVEMISFADVRKYF